MVFSPRHVYEASDGTLTKAFYEEMNNRSIHGQLATALFRCQKRSSAAKKYRGRRHTGQAYSVKNWSLGETCRILTLLDKHHDAPYVWGWGLDPKAIGFEHVLYLELNEGQVSFHSSERLTGPEYAGEWDGKSLSADRIIAFCERVLATESFDPEPIASTLALI